MKQQKFSLGNFSMIQVAFLLLILGMVLGVVYANLFQDNYIEALKEYESSVISGITSQNINYSGLFRYILSKNLQEFLVFWLLTITVLGIPFMAFKITAVGFHAGFLISALTIQYGWKGIFLVFISIIPHGLLYIPISLICLYKGFEMNRTIYQENRSHFRGITKLMQSNLLLLLLLAAALLLACFLEAYPGAYLLKKALGIL